MLIVHRAPQCKLEKAPRHPLWDDIAEWVHSTVSVVWILGQIFLYRK